MKKNNNKSSVLKKYLKSSEKFHNNLNKDFFKDIGVKGIESLNYDVDHYDYQVLDLYYWEHRMGRWHPELLNETDLAFDTFLPFNLRAILDIGMAFSFEKRKSGYLFKELINKSYPILNFYGVNEIKNLYEKFRGSELNDKYKFIDNYFIYDDTSKTEVNKVTHSNTLKIPEAHLIKGNYTFIDYFYSSKKDF
ncbi:hypothetical protein [Jeotgalicoccus sp. WY2]|uniref:hypothetical protein n=1 Tax=Jeotgalicoccus sp. WY2 TaxID=2708346 RepID=UPI001BD28A5D|nr:hypothetical protein [Jeotgalicoccus sp. WY2]